jgi:DNA-directed RNA polymerase specialized sigma24 family protein
MTHPPELSADATDAQIMRAARTSNDAFCLLYDRYAERIFRWCQRHAQDAASDLTAEIFAQAWISRKSFKDRAGGSAGPWLFGIARNVLRDSVRKKRGDLGPQPAGASDRRLTRCRLRLGR